MTARTHPVIQKDDALLREPCAVAIVESGAVLVVEPVCEDILPLEPKQ